jgi:hypothetical protein
MGTEPESVYAQKETMQDVLARCLKKTDPSMYIDQNTCILVKRYSTFFEQYSLEGNIQDTLFNMYMYLSPTIAVRFYA